jgi:uncharacterized UPF0160 family protein
MEQVKEITKILEREIKVAQDDIEGRNIIIKAYEEQEDKRIIELSNSFPRYLLQDTLCVFKEPIFVIYPGSFGKNWKVEAIKKDENTLESRKPFPVSWRGFGSNDPQLKEITGVPDAVFSHKGGFLMNASSLEGAKILAKKALELE